MLHALSSLPPRHPTATVVAGPRRPPHSSQLHRPSEGRPAAAVVSPARLPVGNSWQTPQCHPAKQLCRAGASEQPAASEGGGSGDGSGSGGQQPPQKPLTTAEGDDGSSSSSSNSSSNDPLKRTWPRWYTVWIWATALTYLVWRFKWRRDRRLAAEQFAHEQQQEQELQQEWHEFAKSYGVNTPRPGGTS